MAGVVIKALAALSADHDFSKRWKPFLEAPEYQNAKR